MNALEKIDLYAWSRPKTREDIAALLVEARAELANIKAHFDAAFETCASLADA